MKKMEGFFLMMLVKKLVIEVEMILENLWGYLPMHILILNMIQIMKKLKQQKKTQEISFNNTCKLIDIAKNKSKNIILSGGCALNCSNNFKYVKKYPDLNFFVDPIPHDAGTAIGVAIYYDNYKK